MKIQYLSNFRHLIFEMEQIHQTVNKLPKVAEKQHFTFEVFYLEKGRETFIYFLAAEGDLLAFFFVSLDDMFLLRTDVDVDDFDVSVCSFI